MRQRTFQLWISSLVVTMAIGVVLGSRIDDARDLVKIRNALLFEVGPPDAFEWRPESSPPTFQAERLPAPSELRAAAVNAVGPEARGSDFEKALGLARHLVANRQPHRAPIQKSTIETYREIVGEGEGYCADYTQVFNGLALSAGLEVREWGMAFEGYGGNGHAFSEVFDKDLNKWIFLDSFFSFYATDHRGMPLSALELRDRLLRGSDDLQIVPILPDKYGFKTPDMAVSYYRRGSDAFYLWWGNNVFTYDAHPVVGPLGNLSRSVQQLVATFLGVQPTLMLASGHEHSQGLFELRLIRYLLFALSFAVAVFAITSLVLIMRAYKSRATILQ